MSTNPLAVGTFCPTCATRLQTDFSGTAGECPFGCKEDQ